MTFIVNSFILYNFQLYLEIHNHLNRAPSPWGIHLWIFLEVFHYKFSFMYKLYWFPWGIPLWIFLEVFLYKFPSRRILVCFPTYWSGNGPIFSMYPSIGWNGKEIGNMYTYFLVEKACMFLVPPIHSWVAPVGAFYSSCRTLLICRVMTGTMCQAVHVFRLNKWSAGWNCHLSEDCKLWRICCLHADLSQILQRRN